MKCHPIRWCLCLGVILALAGAGSLAVAEDKADASGDKKEKVEVKAGELTLKVPANWKQGKATSQFRAAQFEVPPAEGDEEAAELVVFYFGKGGGGGVNANVERWIRQFQPEERKVKVLIGESEQGKYAIVDLSGTYNKPIGPPIQQKTEPMPNARMLGVILQTEKAGDYFIKFTGPEKTIAQAADDFRASFGGSADKEKELKPETKESANGEE